MDSCDTASIRYAIGEAFDEANVSQLQSESQSRQVRVLRPGDVAHYGPPAGPLEYPC